MFFVRQQMTHYVAICINILVVDDWVLQINNDFLKLNAKVKVYKTPEFNTLFAKSV